MIIDRDNLCGSVIRGEGYGRVLGFPTANIQLAQFEAESFAIPPGVYAGTAQILGGRIRYRAGIVIEPLPGAVLPKIGAHLLDFSGNLYGKELNLSLKQYLRPFVKFASVEELRNQIERDLALIRELVSVESKEGSPSKKRNSRKSRPRPRAQ